MNRKAIDSSVAGSSKSQKNDESELKLYNSDEGTRKRAKTAVDTSEETSTKRRKLDSSADVPTKQNVNEKIEVDSSAKESASATKKTESVDDLPLPPEMIQAVLNQLTSDDLLKCRRVNHKWNKLSSQILYHRADEVLRFRFKDGNFKKFILVKHNDLMGTYIHVNWPEYKADSLTDLLDCFKDYKHLPYTSFDFGDLAHFKNEDMKKFLSIWGKHIRCLKLKIIDPEEGVELKQLLLQQIPNLKKLEIEFINSVEDLTPIQQVVPLFQNYQLHKLEVLVVDTGYRRFRVIIEDILAAACNLKEFACNTNDFLRSSFRPSTTKEDLIMLQSLNKLQCLKAIGVHLSEDFITYWTKSLKHSDLKLRTLYLSFGEIWENQQLKLDATSVVNQLLESSKVVIDTLAMEPIGLLPGVIFPKLENLRELHLFKAPHSASAATKRTMFPQPFEMCVIFPNLKELEMYVDCTDDYFPQSLTPMPSIVVLRLYGDSSPGNKERILEMTPNVKSLLLAANSPFLQIHAKETFVNGFQVIVNNLKKLETFGWVIRKMSPYELLYKLDEAMTGLTEDFCKEMSEKFRNKDTLSAEELTLIELQRKQSSILDLKELKTMDVTFLFDAEVYSFYAGEVCGSDCDESDCEGDCGRSIEKQARAAFQRQSNTDEAGYERQSIFHKTGFTKVSEFLAFKLMPNLKIRTQKINLILI